MRSWQPLHLLKTDLLTEIRFVKSDINCIKEEICTIKQNQVTFKQIINTLQNNQKSIDIDVTGLKRSVRDLEQKKELLMNDIDWLNDELCKKGERMDSIEKHIDHSRHIADAKLPGYSVFRRTRTRRH